MARRGMRFKKVVAVATSLKICSWSFDLYIGHIFIFYLNVSSVSLIFVPMSALCAANQYYVILKAETIVMSRRSCLFLLFFNNISVSGPKIYVSGE